MRLSSGSGLGATFNDTSTDARKLVAGALVAPRPMTVYNAYNPTNGSEGCLGLGTPWINGNTLIPAAWNAVDGLYEAAPPLCVNNGAFFISPGVYSQPCTDVFYSQAGPQAKRSTRSPTTCLPATAGSVVVADPP